MYRVNNTHKLTLAAAVAMSLAAPSAFATNGYFAHGYGTESKAMAGVGAAMSEDSLSTASNPGGMAFVGDRFDLGMEFFSPRRGYSITGSTNAALNQSQESDFGFFVVPSMGVNFVLSTNDTFGVAVYGNGGMNTEYSKAVFGGAYGGTAPAGVDLIQMFVPLTYAHKFNATSAVGIAVIPVYQQFKAYGLTPFGLISSHPNQVSNNGYDGSSGLGFRIGGQMGIASGVTLGISYQPKINMSPFKKYAGLFAENGDFDIPSTYVLGVAWKATPDLTVALDYERINYTDVKSVSNPAQLPPPVSTDLLGTANGPGFGWSDIDVYKLGMKYVTGTWAWRLGWNHGGNPVKADPVNSNGEVMFNIVAPGVVKDHYTFGFTKTLNPTVDINFAGMYAPKVTVTGTNPVIFGGGTSSIHMYQMSAEVSIGVKF